jgi:hypothetical protein
MPRIQKREKDEITALAGQVPGALLFIRRWASQKRRTWKKK